MKVLVTISLMKALVVETIWNEENIFVSPIASFVNHYYNVWGRDAKYRGKALKQTVQASLVPWKSF